MKANYYLLIPVHIPEKDSGDKKEIQSKTPNENYRNNYETIFGKNKVGSA
jgi:hypothetical protein